MSISVCLPQPKWDRFILQHCLYSNVIACPNSNNPWGKGVDNQSQWDLFGIVAACTGELPKTGLNKWASCGRGLRWQVKGAIVGPDLELAVTCCLLPASVPQHLPEQSRRIFFLAGLSHCFPSRGHNVQTRTVITPTRNDFRNDTAKVNKCAEPETPKAGHVRARHALCAARAAQRLAKGLAASRASTLRC